MTFLCFPKFLVGRSAEQLTADMRGAGLDGVAIPVREGYWVTPQNLASSLRTFRATLATAGLSGDYVIINQDPFQLATQLDMLKTLAGEGITQVRIGYVRGDEPAFDAAHAALATIAEAALAVNIQVVVQCHHGTWHASPTAAWHLVRDIPAKAIGVKVDPGNQTHEGRADPRRALALLGSHLAAVGVKDAAWERTVEGGWRCRWVDVPTGCAGWLQWATVLRERQFAGPYVFHAFAHERDPSTLLSALGTEVAWLRSALAVTSVTPSGT